MVKYNALIPVIFRCVANENDGAARYFVAEKKRDPVDF